jgi:hypothetical protein
VQVAHPEAEVVGVAWHAARVTFALKDHHGSCAEATQLGGRREARRPATDDQHVGSLDGHATPVPIRSSTFAMQ